MKVGSPALAEVVEHGIGDITHTRLQWKELLGRRPDLYSPTRKLTTLRPIWLEISSGAVKGLHAVIGVSVHYAHDFGGIDLQHGAAHAVVRGVDRYLAATRRIERHIYIVHAEQRLGQLGVKLDEDFFSQYGVGGNITHTAAKHNLAVRRDVGSFNNGEVDVAVCAIAYFLRHFRQMAVEIVTVVRVDALTQVGHVLIRSTHIVCVSTGEHTVNMVAGRRPGKHVYL